MVLFFSGFLNAQSFVLIKNICFENGGTTFLLNQ